MSRLYQKWGGQAVSIGLGSGGSSSSGIDPEDILNTISAIETNTTSGKIVDALVIKTYSNLYKDRIVIDNIAIDATGVGTWCSKDTWDATDTADWIGANDAATSELLKSTTVDEDLEFQFMYEVEGGEPIYIGGYQWDSTAGRMCIKFGAPLTKVGKIAIDIIRMRGN